jgi:hypothetical protein
MRSSSARMKLQIDLKSTFAGLVVGLLAAFTLGASTGRGIAQIGRFQLAGTHSHCLLIDTASGKVWRGYFAADAGVTDGDFFKPKLSE